MGPKGKQGLSDIPRFVPKRLNGNHFPGEYAKSGFSFTYLGCSRYRLEVNMSKVSLVCDLNGTCEKGVQKTTMKALYTYNVVCAT